MSDLNPSHAERPPLDAVDNPEQIEREAIFAQLRELKEQGIKFRMPNADSSMQNLRRRLRKLQESVPAVAEAEPEPEEPKPKKKKKKRTAPASVSWFDFSPPEEEVVYEDEEADDEPPDDADDGRTYFDDGTPVPTADDAPLHEYIPPARGSRQASSVSRPGAPAGNNTVLHTMYYTGLAAGGLMAAKRGFPEFAPLGLIANQNRPTIDPVLSKVATELGWTTGMMMDAKLQLALMTGVMASSCYCNSKRVPPGAKETVDIFGQFLSLNLVLGSNDATATANPGSHPSSAPPADGGVGGPPPLDR